jgi:hypothetical protein
MSSHRSSRDDQAVYSLDLNLGMGPRETSLNQFLGQLDCFRELLVLLGLRHGQEGRQVSLGDSDRFTNPQLVSA